MDVILFYLILFVCALAAYWNKGTLSAFAITFMYPSRVGFQKEFHVACCQVTECEFASASLMSFNLESSSVVRKGASLLKD